MPLVFALPPDRFAEARLTLPGAKRARPEAWFKVLELRRSKELAGQGFFLLEDMAGPL